MKKFDELTPNEQERAREYHLRKLLEAIVEGGVRFNAKLNGDDLQARIDAAGEKADANQTPWFWGEMIMETCGDDLRSIAEASAEDALYAEPTDPQVVVGIADEWSDAK